MLHFINGISGSACDEWYIGSENKHDMNGIRFHVRSGSENVIKLREESQQFSYLISISSFVTLTHLQIRTYSTDIYIASIGNTWPSFVFLQFFEHYLKMAITINYL